MSCNAHLRTGLGCFNSCIVEFIKKMLKENILKFNFLISLIFAVEMLKFFFTHMFISVLPLVFLFSQRTQINGEKSLI